MKQRQNGDKPTHGGRRPGAGRPKGDGGGKTYSFRADRELAEVIDAQRDKTSFIRECIINRPQPTSNLHPLHLPFYDINIVAGFPIPLDNDEKSQDIDMLRLLCPHPEASYLIRVSGDSMIDAGIFNGDIVIVDKSNRNPSSKDIAVCELNGEYTLKRYGEDSSGRWLIPANPDFPRIPISDSDSFCIWGIVTYIIHKARD